MSTLSQFAPFAGGGLKSYQTGYFSTTSSAGSGEDGRYVDVTVSAVTVAKTIPNFIGSQSPGGSAVYFNGVDYGVAQVLPRMISTTVLRCASPAVLTTSMVGRWYIAEAN